MEFTEITSFPAEMYMRNCVWSPDSRHFLQCDDDDVVASVRHLFANDGADTMKYFSACALQEGALLYHAAWSPAGDEIVIEGDEGRHLLFVNILLGRTVCQIEVPVASSSATGLKTVHWAQKPDTQEEFIVGTTGFRNSTAFFVFHRLSKQHNWTLLRVGNNATDIALSPCCRFYAVTTNGLSFQIYSVLDGEALLQERNLIIGALCVAWNPSSTKIVVGCYDNVALISLQGPRPVPIQDDAIVTLSMSENSFQSVTFVGDTKVLSCSRTGGVRLDIIDSQRNEPSRPLRFAHRGVNGGQLALSPCGTRLLSWTQMGIDDKDIVVFDIDV